MFNDEKSPIQVHTFDCGTASSTVDMTPPPDEISDCGFFNVDEAERRLAPYEVHRLRPALAARRSGRAAYLRGGGELAAT